VPSAADTDLVERVAVTEPAATAVVDSELVNKVARTAAGLVAGAMAAVTVVVAVP
jgi:hypothetical protein